MATIQDTEFLKLVARLKNVLGYLKRDEITQEEALQKIVDIILQIKFI